MEFKKKAVVVIPIHQATLSKTEECSIRNSMAKLNSYDAFIIGPMKLKSFFEKYKKRHKFKFSIAVFEDSYFDSIGGYNKLLRSNFFYSYFSDYEYMLIVQLDAFVFSDQLALWCNKKYSYLGAPWFAGFEAPSKPLTFIGVGNGGFSLRKIADFTRVLSFPRYIPNPYSRNRTDSLCTTIMKNIIHKFIFSFNFYPLLPRVNEDFFWGSLVKNKCKFFKVPTSREAVSFAFETEPRFMYKLNNFKLPFGCHAWKKYDEKFWMNIFRKNDINVS